MKGLALWYERLARTILMVFVVNVAFVAHTLLGAILGGFFPSIGASYATFREWVRSTDRSWTARQSWTTFHEAWRADVLAANLFGWPQLAGGMLLAWEYYVVSWNDMGTVGVAVSGVLFIVNLLFGVFVLLSWVLRANFDERPWWIVRMSMRMVVVRPLCSLQIIALLLLTAWAWYTWPGIAVTFGLTVPILGVVLTVFVLGRLPGMDIREQHRPYSAPSRRR